MNLPGDVIFQILLMLPVRSLLRFRCVCKEWCTLTKSSLFEDTHLALQRATSRNDEFIVYKQRRPIIYSVDDYNDSVICCNGDYESLALSVSFASLDRFEIPGDFIGPVRIVNHVNGIICVYGIKRFSVILVNPALREVKKLPVPAGLGFTWYIQTFGFGWDDTTNDYKVVGLLKSRCVPRSYKAIIYRLCTDSWTILGEMPAFFLGRAFGRRILFHGSIHWLMDGNDEGRISTSKDDCQILTFNMTTELFQVIDFPSGWKDYDYESCSRQLFVVERSNIALVAFTNPCVKPILLDVWVMKDYGVTESWSRRYSIKPFLEIEWLISFWGKDKLLFKARDGKLNCYDLSKGEIYQPLHQKPSVFVHKYSGVMTVGTTIQISSGYLCSVAGIIYLQSMTNGFPEPSIDLKYLELLVFSVGTIGNFYHHYLLSKLRNKKELWSYKIPHGGLFKFVVCPHYLFEIIAMIGISLISQNLLSYSNAIGCALYLSCRSYATKKWYLSKFQHFPKNLKALIPFLF